MESYWIFNCKQIQTILYIFLYNLNFNLYLKAEKNPIPWKSIQT